MLAPEGFHLLTAASGADALAMVAQQPPDLILLDIMMPGMDGYQVARRIIKMDAIGRLASGVAHEERSCPDEPGPAE